MSDFLLPTNDELTISEKRRLFAVKNRMIEIPSNFPKSKIKSDCSCGQEEDMTHIYNCEILNSEKPNLKYDRIFNGSICEQIEVFNRFEENMKKRENILNEKRTISPSDPPVIHCSNSNG